MSSIKDKEEGGRIYIGSSCRWNRNIEESGDISLASRVTDRTNPKTIHSSNDTEVGGGKSHVPTAVDYSNHKRNIIRHRRRWLDVSGLQVPNGLIILK